MKNIVVLIILTFRYIYCLHLMYAEVAWVLVSSGTQVQPQILLDPDYLPDYLSISYDNVNTENLLRRELQTDFLKKQLLRLLRETENLLKNKNEFKSDK